MFYYVVAYILDAWRDLVRLIKEFILFKGPMPLWEMELIRMANEGE